MNIKILDKYVIKNFLTGYCIAFGVLIGLRVIIDLFVNLDEFSQTASLGIGAVMLNIVTYYVVNMALYFRDFSGMIIVVAAAFALGRMVRNNELVAIMTSGVSLKRVIAPIVVLSIGLTVLLVIDQELIIPPLSDQIVRGQDALPGQGTVNAWFITDENGSLICSPMFDVETATLSTPTIITRKHKADSLIWEVTGRIDADKAVYDSKNQRWALVNGRFAPKDANTKIKAVSYYESDLGPKDIPVRRKADNKTLLSSHQLTELAAQRTKVKDLAQLYSQKHFRITEPIMNVVMLLVCLPILVCRDPKAMKSAIVVSFSLTGFCMTVNFLCKLLATEDVIFARVIPEFWAWLPIFIFLPIAFIQLDSMKT